MHDGILPAAQASLYELAGSVGPGAVPRQLAGSADLQHQRVEQVSVVTAILMRLVATTSREKREKRSFYSFSSVFKGTESEMFS